MKNNKLENFNHKVLEVIDHLAFKKEVPWIEVARINNDGIEDNWARGVFNLLQIDVAVKTWKKYLQTHPQSEIKFHIDFDDGNPYEFDDFSYYTDIIDTGSTILTIAEMIEVYGGVQ
jgi:hypothetical protein